MHLLKNEFIKWQQCLNILYLCVIHYSDTDKFKKELLIEISFTCSESKALHGNVDKPVTFNSTLKYILFTIYNRQDNLYP